MSLTYQIWNENKEPLRLFTPYRASSVREISDQYWGKYPDETGERHYISCRRKVNGIIIHGEILEMDYEPQR